ncbi:GDSL-type esterase/lipase family protein [Actinomycetota bacterium Odt1-20B]
MKTRLRALLTTTALCGTATGCVNPLPEPLGAGCAKRHTQGGTDTCASAVYAWAPAFDTVLQQIHQHAPHARVFVVGYGNYPRPGGCHPTQPFWPRDADYIQSKVNRLGDVLRRTAARHGAAFLDTYSLGTGHDSCAAPRGPLHRGRRLHPRRVPAAPRRRGFPGRRNGAGRGRTGRGVSRRLSLPPGETRE